MREDVIRGHVSSGPALPGINYNNSFSECATIKHPITYHAYVVPVEQGLGELRFFLALWCCLTCGYHRRSTHHHRRHRTNLLLCNIFKNHVCAIVSNMTQDTPERQYWLTKSSNPRSVPVNSRSLFMITHIREPMHLSINSEVQFSHGYGRSRI